MITDESQLPKHFNDGIRRMMGDAYRSALTNPREARFMLQMRHQFTQAEKRRQRVLKEKNLQVPPFLICSIATLCNLNCKGCYARESGIAVDKAGEGREMMSAEIWNDLFRQAADLGICFCLLAGGEPFTRKDVIEMAAQERRMIFPIFTNGTMLNTNNVGFFKQHRNMIPIISMEGDATNTDDRRGEGVYRRVMNGMDLLQSNKIFFGTSITVTTENKERVTSESFINDIRKRGCKIVFFVEYVPTTPGTEYLAFQEEDVMWMEKRVDECIGRWKEMMFLSFPGDEKVTGGCVAAGRGFFHIGPDGSAEPCPFSPYSDCNVKEVGVEGALHSKLFTRLKDIQLVGGEHTGGCVLYEHREEVEDLLKP